MTPIEFFRLPADTVVYVIVDGIIHSVERSKMSLTGTRHVMANISDVNITRPMVIMRISDVYLDESELRNKVVIDKLTKSDQMKR